MGTYPSKKIRMLVLATVVAATVGVGVAGCGSSGSSSSAASEQEAQSAASGDIPDNQQFVRYSDKAAGYSILYPEGWARKGSPTDLTFSDKDNQVQVLVSNGAEPGLADAKAALSQQVPASDGLQVASAETTTVSGSPAIHITYKRLGPKDPVTGKQLTVMVDRYVLASNGRVATVDESTPVGVDNVDAYLMMIQSFRWS